MSGNSCETKQRFGSKTVIHQPKAYSKKLANLCKWWPWLGLTTAPLRQGVQEIWTEVTVAWMSFQLLKGNRVFSWSSNTVVLQWCQLTILIVLINTSYQHILSLPLPLRLLMLLLLLVIVIVVVVQKLLLPLSSLWSNGSCHLPTLKFNTWDFVNQYQCKECDKISRTTKF